MNYCYQNGSLNSQSLFQMSLTFEHAETLLPPVPPYCEKKNLIWLGYLNPSFNASKCHISF